MNWQENKLEISILVATAIAFSAVFVVSQDWRSGKHQAGPEISYEMPRPKMTYNSEFDLAGREIQRNYVNPNATKTPLNASKPKELKPKNGLIEKSKQTAKAQAAAALSKKKPQLKVKVVNKDPQTVTSQEGVEVETIYSGPMTQTEPVKKQTQTQAKPKPQQEEEKDWKKIFQTAATQQNMVEFVQAYYSKKVADDLYFEVIRDLLSSQNGQNQSLGMYGLRSVYSVRSFVEATHFEQVPEIQKAAGLQPALQSYLLTYNKPQRLGMLDAALRSNDNEVVLKASQIIIEGIAKIRAGEAFGSNRDQRNPVELSSLANYKNFIPTLQILSHSADQEIAAAANSTLIQIQSVANIAQSS